MKNIFAYILSGLITLSLSAQTVSSDAKKVADSLNIHKVILDNESKIISWITPQSKAYSEFLRQRWNYIKTSVPNRPGSAPGPSYPQYYFYCAYHPIDGRLQPDTWMNDIGERIPNWFESARLYYVYTGG